jgi:hypothetical protein
MSDGIQIGGCGGDGERGSDGPRPVELRVGDATIFVADSAHPAL